MANIICKKWFLFQAEIKKKILLEDFVHLWSNRAAPDQLTIPLDKLPCSDCLDYLPTAYQRLSYSLSILTCEDFDLSNLLHALCFISNVYKQRFLGLVKFLKKSSNRTSLF